MMNTTISKIEEAFDHHEIRYKTVDAEKVTYIEAWFNIECGPSVQTQFIPFGNDGHSVLIRILGLMHHVPKEKRFSVLEACNRINSEMRFFSFYLDKDNNIIGQSDLPSSTSADAVGENCFELFAREMQILNQCYHYFPEAVYGGAVSEKLETLKNALTSLQDLRDHPITIPDHGDVGKNQ